MPLSLAQLFVTIMPAYALPGLSSSDAPALRALDYCLRVIVAVQCIGVGRWLYLGGSALGPDAAAGMAVLLLGAVPFVLLRPGRAVLLMVVACQLVITAATTLAKPGVIGLLQPAAHAVRYLGPLGLALLVSPPAAAGRRPVSPDGIVYLLRVGAAGTFAAHGLEAILLNPSFVSLIESAGMNLLGMDVPDAFIPPVLRVIGVVDVLLAGAILTGRWRAVALYMAFWGWITAGSRILHFGFEAGVHETLLRFANGGLAFAVFVYWHLARQARRRDPAAYPARAEGPVAVSQPA